jgi:ubiquinone/menaquinone biosynthesis C-methylase UbiE
MNEHQKITIDQFTRQAMPFSRSSGHLNEESLRLLVEWAELSGQDTVLDVACGTGMVACAFAQIARHVSGIDLTSAMLEQAKLLAQQRNLSNLSWYEGDIEALPFSDNSFSVVLSRYAFHHFLNPRLVISEMSRVCHPGGKIMIVDAVLPPEKIDAYNRFEKLLDPSHNRALTMEEMQGLVKEAGLQDMRLAFYEMEMELEGQLAASFPNPGDEERIRRLVRDDIGIDRLGVGAHMRGDEIHYAYPVTVVTARKAG